MRMEDYDLLVQLHQCGTIRSTAKKILLSQPAITQRLKYIEEEWGGEIFVRTSKKLWVTPFGELILSSAREMLQKEEELRTKLAMAEGQGVRHPVDRRIFPVQSAFSAGDASVFYEGLS